MPPAEVGAEAPAGGELIGVAAEIPEQPLRGRRREKHTEEKRKKEKKMKERKGWYMDQMVDSRQSAAYLNGVPIPAAVCAVDQVAVVR